MNKKISRKDFIPITVEYNNGHTVVIHIAKAIKKDRLFVEDNHSTHPAWNKKRLSENVAKGKETRFKDKYEDFSL